MPAKRKATKKRVSKQDKLPVKRPTRLDNVTREEIFISLVWVSVLVATGIILGGTRYATYVLTVIVIGMIGCLIVFNYDK